MRAFFLPVALFCLLAASPAAADIRIKDLVDVEGVRGNDLVGYGLVVGLDGTGDTVRNSPYTEAALSGLLERLGVTVRGESFSPRNVAAVIVTAALPPFARTGSQIDVTISAIGDATSLLGGALVLTPLNAADGEIYAVAQGPVLASGISAEGQAARTRTGSPTSATIPQGARVERGIPFAFGDMRRVRLALRHPDFTTADRIERAIAGARLPLESRLLDAGTVELLFTGETSEPARLLSTIENLGVDAEQRARVVIDQKSGTVVIGADVRISAFGVTQGNLTITVRERPIAAQPAPFSDGETVVLPDTEVGIEASDGGRIAVVDENVTLADLIAGLNALGVGPRELIDILKSVKAAGALHAELVIL